MWRLYFFIWYGNNDKNRTFTHNDKNIHKITCNYGAAVVRLPPENISIILPFVSVVSEHELILITENMNSIIRLSNNVTAIITTMDK